MSHRGLGFMASVRTAPVSRSVSCPSTSILIIRRLPAKRSAISASRLLTGTRHAPSMADVPAQPLMTEAPVPLPYRVSSPGAEDRAIGKTSTSVSLFTAKLWSKTATFDASGSIAITCFPVLAARQVYRPTFAPISTKTSLSSSSARRRSISARSNVPTVMEVFSATSKNPCGVRIGVAEASRSLRIAR